MQRVGLDRIDRPAGHVARQPAPDQPQQQAAPGGPQHHTTRIAALESGQPSVIVEREQDAVGEQGAFVDAHHQQAGGHPHAGGQHDQPDLVGADQCAQRLRRVQHPALHRGGGETAVGACRPRSGVLRMTAPARIEAQHGGQHAGHA